jgi:GT2 family glycosyltransferase
MNPEHLITLSIVSHGDADKISRLLASIQRYETDIRRFQIILTDNLKNDLPDFDPLPWHSFHIIRNRQQAGFAKNHNKAFELAQGGYFAILNPDLVFVQPIFERLITRLYNLRADLIAPQLVDENGNAQDSFRSLPTPWEIIRRRLPGYQFETVQADEQGLIQPDWMAGMFWFMRSDVYRQLGGMDERYRLYFEDVDFCARARIKGMKFVVDTRLTVRHDAQRSSRRNLYYLFLHGQSAMRFFRSPVYRQVRSL